jgi:hypothetical protein
MPKKLTGANPREIDMPTYDYKCETCDAEASEFQTIGEYTRAPIRPMCCGFVMERKLSVVPGTAASNPLAGDRHYEGLAASDGTNIGSRTAHRNYMKSKDLALATDFKETWTKAAHERLALRKGEADRTLKREVREVVERAIQN